MKIKHLISVLLCLFLMVSALDAQIISGGGTSTTRHTQRSESSSNTKLFAGYDRGWLSDDDDLKSKGGFLIGISNTKTISDLFAIEPGIRYIQKGFKYDYNDSYLGYSYKGQSTWHVLDPFFKTKLVNLAIPVEPFIGVSTSYLMWTHYKVSSEGYSDSDSESQFDEIELNLLFGADYVHQNKFVFNIEYSLGLVRILEGEDRYGNASDYVSRTLIFSVGLLF